MKSLIPVGFYGLHLNCFSMVNTFLNFAKIQIKYMQDEEL